LASLRISWLTPNPRARNVGVPYPIGKSAGMRVI
jgi:hypothetical protein